MPDEVSAQSSSESVTFRDRVRCFLLGHNATYGTLFGWCKRCQHTIHTYDHRSVLYYGKYHRFPPAHTREDTR